MLCIESSYRIFGSGLSGKLYMKNMTVRVPIGSASLESYRKGLNSREQSERVFAGRIKTEGTARTMGNLAFAWPTRSPSEQVMQDILIWLVRAYVTAGLDTYRGLFKEYERMMIPVPESAKYKLLTCAQSIGWSIRTIAGHFTGSTGFEGSIRNVGQNIDAVIRLKDILAADNTGTGFTLSKGVEGTPSSNLKAEIIHVTDLIDKLVTAIKYNDEEALTGIEEQIRRKINRMRYRMRRFEDPDEEDIKVEFEGIEEFIRRDDSEEESSEQF
jgi:hypothetical protein